MKKFIAAAIAALTFTTADAGEVHFEYTDQDWTTNLLENDEGDLFCLTRSGYQITAPNGAIFEVYVYFWSNGTDDPTMGWRAPTMNLGEGQMADVVLMVDGEPVSHPISSWASGEFLYLEGFPSLLAITIMMDGKELTIVENGKPAPFKWSLLGFTKAMERWTDCSSKLPTGDQL